MFLDQKWLGSSTWLALALQGQGTLLGRLSLLSASLERRFSFLHMWPITRNWHYASLPLRSWDLWQCMEGPARLARSSRIGKVARFQAEQAGVYGFNIDMWTRQANV